MDKVFIKLFIADANLGILSNAFSADLYPRVEIPFDNSANFAALSLTLILSNAFIAPAILPKDFEATAIEFGFISPNLFKFLVILEKSAVFVFLEKLTMALDNLFTPEAIVANPLVFTPERDADTLSSFFTKLSIATLAFLLSALI